MDPATLPLLLTVKQVSELTNVPERTVYDYAKKGTWGPLPQAGRKLISRDRVLAWVKGDTVGAVSA